MNRFTSLLFCFFLRFTGSSMFQDLVYGHSLMGLISVGNSSLSETELDQMTRTDLRVLKFYRLYKLHV